ncbi:hypothetical protein ABT160_02745 [Streptomyces sp. NPDC001941]|uniref:hypothetical protein n=1 Tax=Streptomyces sp. NPDC001941 TaxID=3154659 RepID=UPI00332BDDC7
MSRRRAYLVTLGLAWAGYGALGMIGNVTYSRSRGIAELTRWVPIDVLGWGWVALGLLAVLAAVPARCPRVQAMGFAAVSTPAALWGTAFAYSAATGFDGAAGGACGWLGFALGTLWVSGMEDPPPRHLRKGRR